MKRAAVIVAGALALSAGSCGGGEETVSEDALRDCLADGGLSFGGRGGLAGPNLGAVSPDFVAALPGGDGVSLVVLGDEERARRKAADVRSALQAFGLTAEGELVITARNAIAVFERPPSAADRDAVRACLEG